VLTAGDDAARFRIPAALNGYNVTSVAASRKSGTGTPLFQLRNVTDAVDVLSTRLSIDSGETDSSTAATPAPGSPYATGNADSFSCTFSKDGAYVYTSGDSGTLMAGFSVNPSTGELTSLPGSPFNFGFANTNPLVGDDSGRLFASSSAGLLAFITDSGAPASVAGNPFAAGVGFMADGLILSNRYWLVADRTSNRIRVYQINGAGAATTLTEVTNSPFAAGGSGSALLALNHTGAYLFVANQFNRRITTMSIDGSTGQLGEVSIQPVDAMGETGDINGMAYVPPVPGPVQGYVYALNEKNPGPNQIFGYAVDESTGALSLLPGFPVNTSGGYTGLYTYVHTLFYDERNARLYAINDLENTVDAYKVDPDTGAISLLYSPIALTDAVWGCVLAHPSGSPLMVANKLGEVASFNVSDTAATAAAGSPFAANTDATNIAGDYSCVLSQDGNYLYLGGDNINWIAGMSVDPTTGVLAQIAGFPTNTGLVYPSAYSTDASGRLFVLPWSSSGLTNVVAYTSAGGALTGVTGSPFFSGMVAPASSLVHPAGYLLVLGRFSQLGVFRISGDGADTALAPVLGSPFNTLGNGSNHMAIDQFGRFVFVVNGDSRSITSLVFNPATGQVSGANKLPYRDFGTQGFASGIVYVAKPPDLALTATHSGSFNAGSTGTYTLHVTNLASPVTITSGPVTVVSTLPTGFSFNTASGAGWTCGAAGQVVTCTQDAVVPGGMNLTDITLVVNVLPTAPESVNFTAEVSSDAYETVTANNSATDATSINLADLTIAKSHTGNFKPGENRYTIHVSNAAAVPAAGPLTVTDNLPVGMSFVSGTGTGWTCGAVGQVVTCTHAGPLAGSASLADITLVVNVSPTLIGETVANTASVTLTGNEPVTTNNSATDSVLVQADLYLPLAIRRR
ncbi:MAG: hypothetical protein EHM70_09880, partial [Chloroflexota bacterium]